MIRALLKMATPPARVPIPARGVDYRGKVVLAPMVRSGELPSRLLALQYGADLVWGPETIDRSMIGTTRRVNAAAGTVDFTRPPSNPQSPSTSDSVIYRLHPERERGRLIFQIGTAWPGTAVEAARLVAADVAGIDVNAGCPKAFSTSGGMGAALLQDPERLASILEALVRDVGGPHQIGISVKIRLLETRERTAALVARLVRTGITGLTVHCRTTPMRPRERAIREQLAMVADLCRDAGVACLMNGDVVSREQGLELAREYGCDGAMIATAAEANSSVFRAAADGGRAPWRDVVREYLRGALLVENKWPNSKFLLSQLMPGKTDEARRCTQARNYEHACAFIGLDDFMDRAKEVDQKLGIAERESGMSERTKNKQAARAHAGQPPKKKVRILALQRRPEKPLEQPVGQAVAMAT